MPLSTHPKVWSMLFLIAIALTAAIGICIYLRLIFMTMLVGLALIVISERVYANSILSLARHFSSSAVRHVYLAGLVFFWVAALALLFGKSLSELHHVLKLAHPAESRLDSIYLANIAPHLPDWWTEKLLTPDRLNRMQADIVPWFSEALSTLAMGTLYGLLLIPVMFFTYCSRRKSVSRMIHRAIPARFQQRHARITTEIARHLADYFSARVIESMLVGAICCLGFFMAGVKGWLILGLLAGILNIADYIGPMLSIIPPAVISLLLNDTLAAGLSVVIVIVAQIVDNFYLIPVMLSDKVKVDPLVTVVLILVGGSLLGVLGILFAIPVYLIYRVVLTECYSELVKIYPDAPLNAKPDTWPVPTVSD